MTKIYQFSLVVILSTLIVGWSHAQYSITRVITDERTGEPMIGASILVSNTSRGTVTHLDGKFNLNFNNNDPGKLVISSLRYLSQTIEVGPNNNNTLNVSLKEDATNLEEVVLTGLPSSVKRSNLANAVSSVSSRELTGTTTIQNTDGALYGNIAGANIRSNGGAPEGGLSIQLRGISSLTGASQPLIILDGVYINNFFQGTGRATLTGAIWPETMPIWRTGKVF